MFAPMTPTIDGDEHSIEMHLPYIAAVMASAPTPPLIVPLLIGALSSQTEEALAALLLPHFLAPDTFFVVSSDFCHWGERFGYSPYDKKYPSIHEYIKALDEEGMGLIEKGDRKAWGKYLKDKKNTICGRYPIGVLMALMDAARGAGAGVSVEWVKYAQSSAVERKSDSSVSYASAVVVLDNGAPTREGKSAE